MRRRGGGRSAPRRWTPSVGASPPRPPSRPSGRWRWQAEPLYREALELTREVLGPRHPRTLAGLNNLAALYERQGRHGEAEPLYREALRLGRFAGSDDGSPKFEYGPPAATDAGREAWVTGGGDDAQVTYGRPR